MQDSLSLTIYALGFVGFAGATLLPLRSWQLYRLFSSQLPWRSSTTIKLLSLLVGIAAGFALALDVQIVSRVFRCLTEMQCGPGRASGWLFLAFLGVAYLAFEALAAVVVFFSRRLASRYAT